MARTRTPRQQRKAAQRWAATLRHMATLTKRELDEIAAHHAAELASGSLSLTETAWHQEHLTMVRSVLDSGRYFKGVPDPVSKEGT